MCCLGFFSIECGYKPKEILSLGMPADILGGYDKYSCGEDFRYVKNYPKVQKLSCVLNKDGKNNVVCRNLASVNDATKGEYKNIKKRESKITQLFSQLGVKVKFVGRVEEKE